MRATEQSGQAEAVEAEWDRIEPVLDGAAAENAGGGSGGGFVLRFLEDGSLKEVGEQLGITEEAARKRVERPLERLREMLVGRGFGGSGVGGGGWRGEVRGESMAAAGACGGRERVGGCGGGVAGGGNWASDSAGGDESGGRDCAGGDWGGGDFGGGGIACGEGAGEGSCGRTGGDWGGVGGNGGVGGEAGGWCGEAGGGSGVSVGALSVASDGGGSEGDDDGGWGFTSGLVAPIKMGEINDTFVFDAAGYGRAWSNVGTAWTVGPVEIRLEEARVIEGVVRNAEGAPVAGAVVEAQLQSERYGYLGLDQKDGLAVKTDEGGAFRFERVPADARAHVRVTPPAGSGYAIFDTSEIALAGYFSDHGGDDGCGSGVGEGDESAFAGDAWGESCWRRGDCIWWRLNGRGRIGGFLRRRMEWGGRSLRG